MLPNNMKTTYFIVDEHTLAYHREGMRSEPSLMEVGILHASVLRGSTWNKMDGWIIINPSSYNLRPATLKDFEDYRVVPPEGFLLEEKNCKSSKPATRKLVA